MAITTKKLIHNGDNTHHQDHVISPASLRAIKTIVNNPQNSAHFFIMIDIISTTIGLLYIVDIRHVAIAVTGHSQKGQNNDTHIGADEHPDNKCSNDLL